MVKLRPKFDAKMISCVALLVSIYVVFVRIISVETLTFRFDFGFVALALASVLFGPLVGGITGVLGDVVGIMIFSRGLPYFPLFTVNAFIYGMTYGVFLYKKPNSFKRVICCVAFETIVVNLALTTVWLYIYNMLIMGNTISFLIIITNRLATAALLVPIKIFGIKLLIDFVCPQIKRVINMDTKTRKFKEYAMSDQSVFDLRLTRIKKLLDLCGNPQNDLKFIHVAGTNGKGSACAFIQSVLTNAGYKTGKYISPNMLCVNERITIDGVQIENSVLEEIIESLKDKSEQVKIELSDSPSQFELWTVVAFIYFKQMNCDIVVLETGLGGTLDATNIVTTTLISVLTKIDVDHKNYLGDTLEEIALAKVGIVKPNRITVTVAQYDEVMNVIKKQVNEKKNKLTISKCLTSVGKSGTCEIVKTEFGNMKLGLSGYYQIENASLSIDVLKELRNIKGFENITDENIIKGIEAAVNIGRFETVSQDPLIIFDGAHNKNGATALRKSLDRYFENKNIYYVVGFMRDKEVEEWLDVMKIKNCVALTVNGIERAMPNSQIKEICQQKGIDVQCCENFKGAIEFVKNKCDLIVVCGSLYLYKEVADELKIYKN